MSKREENLAVYLVGSIGYGACEILWRGFTHWTMLLTGGFCFLSLYRMDRRCKRLPLPRKCVRGALFITGVEFFAGLLINQAAKLQVWDYSSLPFNVLGQICLPYSILWFFLCFPLFKLSGLLSRTLTQKKRA